MTDFPKFASAVESRFALLSKNELYEVDVERDELWGVYLGAFPAGTDPIFRVRTVHDGSYDRAFIRQVGHLVAIVNGKIETLWDIKDLPYPYDVVAAALAAAVRAKAIRSVFRTKESMFGHKPNNELIDGRAHRFTHFITSVAQSHRPATPDAERGKITTNFGVFKRGCEELTIDALNTVLDLINSNSLYRGQEHAVAVSGFYTLKTAYDAAPDKNLFLWQNVTDRSALFRNTVIGSLVVDLSAGEELEKAVRSFEKKVAPENYKRPTALITPKMIEQALEKLKALGLESAVERRFAKLSDVSVNNVLFVDNAVRSQMRDGLAGLLMKAVKPQPIDIKNAEAITVDDFLARIVPQASSIELLLQNKHLANFMSVTAPVDPTAGRLFKWDNGFAWSYDGDVTDSLKQRVKAAGGNVDAQLRFSLGWFNLDDLDIHVRTPTGQHIYYGNKGGYLDVDMNAYGPSSREPVENVSFAGKPKDGVYLVSVNQYNRRETSDPGFVLEVESAGVIQQFSFDRAVNGTVNALEVTVERGVVTNIVPKSGVVGGSASQDKWGVKTETLVPVNTLMASPNHWDGQTIGNKHWFFILKDCVNPLPARGIYNEFLKGDLEPHRKVFEVLGSKTKCEPAAEQLSGVGFSSTRHDQATVVVKGNRINKAFQITF